MCNLPHIWKCICVRAFVWKLVQPIKIKSTTDSLAHTTQTRKQQKKNQNFPFKQLQLQHKSQIIVPLEHIFQQFSLNLCIVNFCRYILMHLSISSSMFIYWFLSVWPYALLYIPSGSRDRFSLPLFVWCCFFVVVSIETQFQFSLSGIVYILLFSVLLKCFSWKNIASIIIEIRNKNEFYVKKKLFIFASFFPKNNNNKSINK